MKIKTAVLFTNRNSMFLGSDGEQLPDLQALVSWKPLEPEMDSKLEELIDRLFKDRPDCFISKWGEWQHEISLDEFCSLIGMGPYYFELKSKKEKRMELMDRDFR